MHSRKIGVSSVLNLALLAALTGGNGLAIPGPATTGATSAFPHDPERVKKSADKRERQAARRAADIARTNAQQCR